MEADKDQYAQFAAGLVTENDLERILKIASCVANGDEAGFSSIPNVQCDEPEGLFGGFRFSFGNIKIQSVRKMSIENWSLASTNFVAVTLWLDVEEWEHRLHLNLLIDASTPQHTIIAQGLTI